MENSNPAKRTKTLALPEVGFVRLPTVLHHIPVSPSNWWDGVKKGIYPKSIKISEGITAWDVEDIRRCIVALKENSKK